MMALLHQHQRQVKTVRHAGTELEYIEVTVERYRERECAGA